LKDKFLLIFLLLGLAVVTVSCGDSEDPESGSASTFSLSGAGS